MALAMVVLVGLLFLAPMLGLPASAQSGSWIATFDGAPSAPQQYDPPTWDVLVHSRSSDTWKQLEPLQAHHGSSCSAPPATHPISGYHQAVFQCNNHMMTAIQAEEYGLVVLTPNQMVDFSTGEAVVRFDMSTFRTSSRDWVSIWLSPWEDQIPLPLEEWLPDLNGDPRRGVHITMDSPEGKTGFKGYTIRDYQATDVTTDYWTRYESFLSPSATRPTRSSCGSRGPRSNSRCPATNKWWVNRTVPDLGWDRAVLQLAHHSYTPWKGCEDHNCGGNTWHWDNVSISRPAPFVMLKPDQPWVDASSRRWVSYPSGAPGNSHLRFMGIGNDLQVSFNGGQSWQNAQAHPVEKAHEDHFRPYWMPVPAGTTRVDFRGSNWYAGGWMVRDPAIWSQTVPLAPPSSDCTTRPRTTVQTQPIGSGKLRVTVQAGRPATAPNNIVRKIQIPHVENAQVEILGQTIGAAGGSATATSPNQSVSFTVTRQAAGATVTVPLVVTDDCGEWNTFVGGGPSAF